MAAHAARRHGTGRVRGRALVGASAAPPRGPYRLLGHGPLSPRGGFQTSVGVSIAIGAPGMNPPPTCHVHFRFPLGDRGSGPAMVSFREVHPRQGVYGDPSITVGNDTDVGGRIYRENASGRLVPTRRFRHA